VLGHDFDVARFDASIGVLVLDAQVRQFEVAVDDRLHPNATYQRPRLLVHVHSRNSRMA
jgi:hypothetical protein